MCIRVLSVLSVGQTRIGMKAPATKIASPPRRHMSSPEPVAVRSTADNCARIKKLGYIAGKHMDLYGEHLELVSDPFEEGEGIAVHAVSESNPTERTIELPISILAGWETCFKNLQIPLTRSSPQGLNRQNCLLRFEMMYH